MQTIKSKEARRAMWEDTIEAFRKFAEKAKEELKKDVARKKEKKK